MFFFGYDLVCKRTIIIVFYKTKTIWATLIENGIHITDVNLKILYEFHMIWPEINGHMSLWLVLHKFAIWILYRFPIIYTYFNRKKNI